MYKLGLKSSDMAAFNRTLRTSHAIAIRMLVLDLEGKKPVDISAQLLDGQVTIEAGAKFNTRLLSATLSDPHASLGIDSLNPADGMLFADRMIRVYYRVHVLELDRWVSVPIFTGPITKLDRAGTIIKVEASSKEHLAQQVWGTYTIPKGVYKSTAIKRIMMKAGENKFNLRETKAKIPNPIRLGPTMTYWGQARQIARSLDYRLFYDGMGVLVSRTHSPKSVYTFRDGDNGTVLTDPEISYDPALIKNTVRVYGKKKKKGRTPRYTAVANQSHPLSPRSLGRNGQPRHLFEIIKSDSYRTDAECKRRAKSFLEARTSEIIDISFDALPIPHLEPYDICTVVTGKMSMRFTLKSYTIPLTAGGVMTIGYRKKHTINRSKIRRNTKRGK